MDAESREAVFAALRAKGIRAIKVVAADGSKANGEIRGIRKRVLVSSVLSAALAAGVVVYFFALNTIHQSSVPNHQTAATPLPRQEIHGDRSRIDGVAETILSTEAERFLARFAEPGRSFVAAEAKCPAASEFEAVLDRPLMIAENEYTEYIDLKRMVEWMKQEMRAYLRGGGDVRGYVGDLIKRQQMESDLRTKHEKRIRELLSPIENREPADICRKALSDSYDYWLNANAQLQTMGIYPIPRPDALRGYQPDVDTGELLRGQTPPAA